MTTGPVHDLTGKWDGIFNYPRGQGSNTFLATLRDAGGLLVGETVEPSDEPSDHDTTLIAWIEGRHDGSNVSFVKSYDDQNRADYTVCYCGMVSTDGLEINGTWEIPGIWAGTFIMIRPTDQKIAVSKFVAEPVR